MGGPIIYKVGVHPDRFFPALCAEKWALWHINCHWMMACSYDSDVTPAAAAAANDERASVVRTTWSTDTASNSCRNINCSAYRWLLRHLELKIRHRVSKCVCLWTVFHDEAGSLRIDLVCFSQRKCLFSFRRQENSASRILMTFKKFKQVIWLLTYRIIKVVCPRQACRCTVSSEIMDFCF